MQGYKKISPERLTTVLLCAIIAVGFLLRFYRLGYHDFWYDEIYSIIGSGDQWSRGRPPAYFLFLRYWLSLFGTSEFSARLPSCLFDTGSIALAYYVALRIFNNRWIGLYVSLGMALSPFLIWYAQEARSYSMALFLGLVSFWLLQQALEESGGRATIMWAAFVAVSALGLYTNYYFLFLIISEAGYLVYSKTRALSVWAFLYFLAILILFLPHLSAFCENMWYLKEGFWLEKPRARALLITLHNFTLGYNSLPVAYFVSDAFTVLFFLFAFWNSDTRKGAFACGLLMAVSFFFVFLFSWLAFSVYLDRGLIIFVPYYYMILAAGIGAIRQKLNRFFLGLGMLTLFAFGLFGYYDDQFVYPSWDFAYPYWNGGVYIKRPVRPIAELLKRDFRRGDVIGFTNPSLMPSVSFYGRNKDFSLYDFYGKVERHSGSPLSSRECFFFDATEGRVGLYFFFSPLDDLDPALKRPWVVHDFSLPVDRIESLAPARIWIVSSAWERDGSMDQNSLLVNKWLSDRFRLELHMQMEGAQIFRYGR